MKLFIISIATLLHVGIAHALVPASNEQDKCEYFVRGTSPVLIRRAREQRLLLISANPECQSFITRVGPTKEAVILRDSDKKHVIPASFSSNVDAYLTLDYVPADLADTVSLEIIRPGTQTRLGTVQLVVKNIVVDALRVSYENQSLDHLQNNTALETPEKGRVAVVSRRPEAKIAPAQPAKWQVQNTASLSLPDGLSSVSTKTDYWTISDAAWDIELKNGLPAHETIEMERVSVVPFAVYGRETAPLRLVLSYLRSGDERKPGSDEKWFKVEIEVAVESREESLPVPISTYLDVECGFVPELSVSGKPSVIIRQRQDIAMDDEDLAAGKCYLRFDNTDGLLERYGPQAVTVTMGRTKATKRTVVWRVDSAKTSLKLFAPDDDDRGEGAYRLEARLSIGEKQVTYRAGVAILDSSQVVLPDYDYSATLRPRGPYATFREYRLFVTFPVDLFAMRFPAVVRYVDKSSDGDTVQLSTFRAGVQIAFEPWDYAQQRNRWPLPLRFNVGLNLFELADKRFAPSFVAGISLVLGTLGDKIPASVTLGFNYERDLTEPHLGSHFLFTSSINFLSLFGPK